MSLDLSTLHLVSALVALTLGSMLLFFWRQERIPALGWWGTAYLIGGLAIALWAFVGDGLDPGALLVLHLAGFIACGMVWNAARVFHGRSTHLLGLCSGALIWTLAQLVLSQGGGTRLLLGAAIVAAYAALTAGELWTERRRAYQSRWVAVAIPMLHGFVLMLPILLGDFLYVNEGGAVGRGWIALFAMELVLYSVGTVFIILMLVSERAVATHKNAAAMDPMTGLFNRRGFSELTERMIRREAMARRGVTVMIFDIDHFKSINDRFGHPAGDEILKLFGCIVVQTLRITDIVGRIGGEEFAAMLPCPVDEAQIAAQRVRRVFEEAGVMVDDAPLETTVSIGLASGAPGADLQALLAAADTALYQAKRNGRNRVEVAVEEEEATSLDRTRQLVARPIPKPKIPVRQLMRQIKRPKSTRVTS